MHTWLNTQLIMVATDHQHRLHRQTWHNCRNLTDADLAVLLPIFTRLVGDAMAHVELHMTTEYAN